MGKIFKKGLRNAHWSNVKFKKRWLSKNWENIRNSTGGYLSLFPLKVCIFQADNLVQGIL
jgi:hypothetical protein